MDLIGSIISAISLAVATYALISITISSVRLSRARRRYNDAAEQMRSAAMLAMQSVGAAACEDVPTHEIKFGDEICWQNPDTEEHADYTAGYDGDPGPSPEGLHLREL
jgi:plastocyanin